MTQLADSNDLPELRVVRGNPTPTELAAVTVMLHAALAETAAGDDREEAPVISAWQRSQRPIRRAIRPGADVWRNFSA